ncbi:hypothetical protein DL89DRAFT_269005 [Linderina pennispora]|uniref:Uncharacterized protein n=1 Tax=Linderina pennispora TaxID=61395 RepID=A0A1Y1W2N3_9FUNG|nr:uncharacterized protein DL89DRAFT_269005 [Linderina pennispora]ORX67810.1 hypothetical protein DL89DRAFT_269005 [Linderina pennispora]
MNVYVFGSSKLPCAVGMFVVVAVFTLALLLLNSNRVGIRLPYEPKEVYTDALNSTLGFHKIYATYDPVKPAADLLDIQIEYIPRHSLEEATKQREERGYLAPVPDIAEFITHMAIYKDMAEFNIQSALILDSSIDMELDLKMRLASALGNGIATSYDLLFIGREFSEQSEPGVDDATKSSSERCLRHWTKINFLNRQPLAFRTSYPHGTHAYVVNNHLARRLLRRLPSRMTKEEHDLDYVLADTAMLGLSIAYSISPPPITRVAKDSASNGQMQQYLTRSTMYAISLRGDNPNQYSPYLDWLDIWRDD